MLDVIARRYTNIWPVLILILSRIEKESRKFNFSVAYDDVTNMKFSDSSKTQKSKYLKNEAIIFLQMKKLFYYASKVILWQKILLQQRLSLMLHTGHISQFL